MNRISDLVMQPLGTPDMSRTDSLFCEISVSKELSISITKILYFALVNESANNKQLIREMLFGQYYQKSYIRCFSKENVSSNINLFFCRIQGALRKKPLPFEQSRNILFCSKYLISIPYDISFATYTVA